MAQLKFSGIQAVEFDGRDCMPTIDTGKRLRLSNVKFTTDAEIEKANQVLASCFPDDEEYVLDFLTHKMTPSDKRILQTYLLQGEKAIAMLDRSVDTFAEKIAEGAMEGANNE